MSLLAALFGGFTIFFIIWPWRAFGSRKRLGPMLRDLDHGEWRRSHVAVQEKGLVWRKWILPIKRMIPYDPYSPQAVKVHRMIVSAGLDGAVDPADLNALKWTVAGGLGAYVGLVGLARGMPEMLIFALAFALIGMLLPNQWLQIRMRARQNAIQRELPQVLISLAVTTDAGLSLLQALQEVANRRRGVLADELHVTVQSMALGTPQREALEQLADRMMVPELTLFVSVLVQTIEKGASGLTELLREQAKEAWIKRKSKARELGEQASVKLFMPLILLSLPALMIFLMTPALFSLIRFFSF